jgi:hypothetical protein
MAKELSGLQWVARFPNANTTTALADDFRPGCEAFIAAMRAAGATVDVHSTRRPAERAYLMFCSWRISKQIINPQDAPTQAGVDIEWVHRKADGSVDLAASRAAATDMVNAFDIAFAPALHSRHIEGHAIDMTIGWDGDLKIADHGGALRTITTQPRDGLNPALDAVGKTYAVVKNPADPPHWSTDGK